MCVLMVLGHSKDRFSVSLETELRLNQPIISDFTSINNQSLSSGSVTCRVTAALLY